MDKVFMVYYDPEVWQDWIDFVGVFSTKEKAEEYIKKSPEIHNLLTYKIKEVDVN
jgi:hypothetical protein